MEIQIASDLHLVLWKRDPPDPERHFTLYESRGLLILAYLIEVGCPTGSRIPREIGFLR